MTMKPISDSRRRSLQQTVSAVVEKTPVFDIHTHLYAPAFGGLLLWGVDELLVYHYLVAEVFRYLTVPYEKFWRLSKVEQADLIWEQLFLQRSPISEACRGVLTTLHLLGLDVKKRDLPKLRQWFRRQKPDAHVDRCMKLANVRRICMTNSPFDDLERPVWEGGYAGDPRFVAALRIDPLLMDWGKTAPRLRQWGYGVTPDLSERTLGEVRRFLADWTKRMQALYVMVSLPPSFQFPEATPRARLIEKAVLPHCREFGIPFAMMPGVKKLVNPALALAGDSVGRSNLEVLEGMLAANPDIKFLLTALSRENQHELCVIARKFRNLHIFGCWWFLNNPSLIEEITRMRLELLGLSLTPQHSDARVLDQLLYKWAHFRPILTGVLTDKYADLVASGWQLQRAEIERDVAALFGGELERFLKM